jgi:hypothetical protein
LLEKSIEEKENFSKILSGVNFYDDGDIFYIIVAKDLNPNQFKTKEGDTALGYSKKR